jgi:hypothetical protein
MRTVSFMNFEEEFKIEIIILQVKFNHSNDIRRVICLLKESLQLNQGK